MDVPVGLVGVLRHRDQPPVLIQPRDRLLLHRLPHLGRHVIRSRDDQPASTGRPCEACGQSRPWSLRPTRWPSTRPRPTNSRREGWAGRDSPPVDRHRAGVLLRPSPTRRCGRPPCLFRLGERSSRREEIGIPCGSAHHGQRSKSRAKNTSIVTDYAYSTGGLISAALPGAESTAPATAKARLDPGRSGGARPQRRMGGPDGPSSLLAFGFVLGLKSPMPTAPQPVGLALSVAP